MSKIKTDKKSEITSNKTEEERGFFELTPEEIEREAQIAVSEAISEAHAQGFPIITVIDGKIYQKYPDGSIVPY